MIGSANDGDRYEQWYRFDVPGTSNTLPTYIEGNPLYSICFPVFNTLTYGNEQKCIKCTHNRMTQEV